MKRLETLTILLLTAFCASLWAEETETKLYLPATYDKMDADRNGEVSENEYMAYYTSQLKQKFASLDKDGNKSISTQDLGITAPPQKPLITSNKPPTEQGLFERLFITGPGNTGERTGTKGHVRRNPNAGSRNVQSRR